MHSIMQYAEIIRQVTTEALSQNQEDTLTINQGIIMSKKYLWLAVDADKYELPIAVASSARELGEMIGSNKHNVETTVLKNCNGRISNRRIFKVEDIDE